MRKNRFLYAFLSAFLFGLSTPLSKIMLSEVPPVLLGGMLYFGSGAGLAVVSLFGSRKKKRFDAADLKWLILSIICGGIIAPVVLLFGLNHTYSGTSSLLLNFEAVATTVIAVLFFKEKANKKIFLSLFLITVACIILTVNFSEKIAFNSWSLLIVLACLMWGMDNNFSKKMSENDPVTIVMIKGISAGAVNIILSLIFEKPTIQTSYIAFSAIIGFFCYGVSIVLFILSLRSIGTSRTSMIFSSAPFFGALVSFVVFRTWPDTIFVLAFSILAFGILILQKADFQK